MSVLTFWVAALQFQLEACPSFTVPSLDNKCAGGYRRDQRDGEIVSAVETRNILQEH